MGYQDFGADLARSNAPHVVRGQRQAIGLLWGIAPEQAVRTSKAEDMNGADYFVFQQQQSSGALIKATAPIVAIDAKNRFESPNGRTLAEMSSKGPNSRDIFLDVLAMGKTGTLWQPQMPGGHLLYLVENFDVLTAVSTSTLWGAAQAGRLDAYHRVHKTSKGKSGQFYSGESLIVPLADVAAMPEVDMLQVQLVTHLEV